MTLRLKVSKTRVFSIILLFSTFTAKAQTADQSNQAIETVLKVTFHDPLLTNPSNKKQVDSLYRLASKTDDKRLLAYLQLFLLNTKSLKSDAPKVNFLQESDKIAENSAYLDVKGFHYYYKGLVLSNRNESAKGLPYFFQAKKYWKKPITIRFLLLHFIIKDLLVSITILRISKWRLIITKMPLKSPLQKSICTPQFITT